MSKQGTILKKEFEKISKDLTKKYDQLGMRASGRWDREKEVVIKDQINHLVGTIWGLEYTGALQFGRGPSKKAGSGESLQDRILQWIRDKGLTFDIPIRSLAYLIARKIHREGTQYFKQGGTDLIDSVITDKRMEEILDKIGRVHVEATVDSMIKQYQKLKTAA